MGLLDLINSDAGMVLAAGLLDAGAAKPVRTGTMQGIAQSLLGAQQYKQSQEERAIKLKQQQAQEQMQAMQLQQLQAALEQQKRKQAQDAEFRGLIPAPGDGDGSMPMVGAGPGEPGSSMPQVSSGGPSSGMPMVGGQQRMQLSPERLQYEAMRLGQISPMDYINSQRKDTTPMKLGAGEALIDPRTFKPLFTNPKEDTTPSAIKEYQFAVNQGYKGTYEQWDRERKRAGATNVSVNTGQKGFDNTLKLRGDFRSEPIYKAHQEMQSAYSQIQQSLNQKSPAGDLAGATKIMKLLDPGSVVRESELGMAMAATGLLDRVQNYAGMVMSGTKLTPTQRADFQRLADALYSESVKQYNGKRSEYQGIADRNGLNVQDVLGDPSASPVKPAQGAKWSPDKEARYQEWKRSQGM